MPASTKTALFFSCHECIGDFLVGLECFPISLPTIAPIETGVKGGLNVVCPTEGTILSSMLETSCNPLRLLVLPWSVAIPNVVYLLTCSIDLYPSLRASSTSVTTTSF